MISDRRHPERRYYSAVRRFVTVLVLWALVAAVFPVSIFAAEKGQTAKGAVYRPLSKKLQPNELPAAKKQPEPFEELCASSKTKENLFREIVLKNPWRIFTLDAKNFENLIFDYLAHGRAALGKLPGTPSAPFENQIKQAVSTVAVNQGDEHKSVGKHFFAQASPTLAARPPTGTESLFSQANSAFKSAKLSRRIAPRAPPIFLS